MLAVLIEPLRRHDDLENIFDDAHLELTIRIGRRRYGRACVNLNKPGFQAVLDQDVIPIHLKAMLIVDDD